MKKVDGKKIAARIKGEIKELLLAGGKKSLGIFYVGNNPVIESYVALKKRVGEELGIAVHVMRFPEDISEESLTESIHRASEKYDGLIVQLPLPAHLHKEDILNSVPAEKDVDVLSSDAYENFKTGKTKKLPPVVSAVKEIIEEYGVTLDGKNIVVVGAGALVGKPVAAWLARAGFSYQIFDRENNDTAILQNADIIISGIGVPGFIKPSMIKEGSVLVDAGTSTSGARLMGDLDIACYDKGALVSGVPGGVGPITVASLFRNLFLD